MTVPPIPVQRVLIIEDEAQDAWLLEWALQELAPEIEVQVVLSGVNLLQGLGRNERPDVVLDLHLGYDTGLEMLGVLRRVAVPAGRVMCWSSHAHPGEVAAGVRGYVQKPQGIPEFLKFAQSLLE